MGKFCTPLHVSGWGAGYTAGEAIAFFEGRGEHPVFKAGDIIVEVNGKTFRTEEEYEKLDQPSKTGFKVFTVLRADEAGILRKFDAVVKKGYPLSATLSIVPLTFEEP